MINLELQPGTVALTLVQQIRQQAGQAKCSFFVNGPYGGCCAADLVQQQFL
jgi:hypothetical protein